MARYQCHMNKDKMAKTLFLLLMVVVVTTGETGIKTTKVKPITHLHQAPLMLHEDHTEEEKVKVPGEAVTLTGIILHRFRRGSGLEEEKLENENSPDDPTRLVVEETLVVHESANGRVVLAGALGTCLGLLLGFLLTLTIGCCILRCSRRRGLEYDRKHNTYRSADIIDGIV